MWQDEAETAMYATRILKYGYPKIHDGKNVVSQSMPSILQARNEKIDAHLEHDWISFYFSAAILSLTQPINDIYLKTALLRIPYAVIGLIGLSLIALSIINIFRTLREKLLFLVLFVLFELFSVSLILHLREVRNYSLSIWTTGCLLYIFTNYHFFGKIKFWPYSLLTVIFLLLTLGIYRPAFFIFMVVFTLHALGHLFTLTLRKNQKKLTDLQSLQLILNKSHLKKVANLMFPFFVSFFLSIPYIIFFKVFSIVKELSGQIGLTNQLYINHIVHILSFFMKFESLLFVLILKSILIILWINQGNININSGTRKKICLSNFLTLFAIIYILIVARIPYFLFTRYFITLQPILINILLLDIFIVFEILASVSLKTKSFARIYFVSIIGIFFVFYGFNNKNYLQGHVYELFNQYKGSLDYIIPYIQNNFANSEKLVIATNYDEYSYMFYLKSKVTVGYFGNNLVEDLKIQPDIIIYRKGWEEKSWLPYSKIFNYFLSKDKYEPVAFSVYDYPLNNIPELNFSYPHLFKTKLALNPNESLVIFIRDKIE